MTAEELRELVGALEPMACAPRFDGLDVPALTAYLRACADAMEAGPVAWVVGRPGCYHTTGYDSSVLNKVPNGTKLYPVAMPAQLALRLPEPMTKAELLAIRMKARASPEAETTNWPALACRAVEAEVIRRIEAALEAKALYLHPPTLRLPEPMTGDDVNKAGGAQLCDLLDHIYEYGTTAEGVMQRAVLFARAIEAEVLRRVKEANK